MGSEAPGGGEVVGHLLSDMVVVRDQGAAKPTNFPPPQYAVQVQILWPPSEC